MHLLGYENGVSSGCKCKKGNGHTHWDTKMVSNGFKCEKENGLTHWDTKME